MQGVNLGEYLLKTASKDKWEKAGISKRAGVLVPLFSVYSRRSLGIGDLEDIKLLMDWANTSGNSIIQLLPMNELGSIFCPYDSISSFALEPAYIALENIPGANKNSLKAGINKLKQEFPCGKAYVDYRIKKEKLALLRDIFTGEGCYLCAELQQFIEDNAYWLRDFALFKVLKDYHQGRPWYEWEDKYKYRDTFELEHFFESRQKEIAFQMWVQWIIFRQFKEVKEYAARKKVLIKGDLPILASRDSADVWSHPEFFKLKFAAGAPADMYCAKGQRWGMPPYNWEKISADGYRYLRQKLRYAQEFYDILRIDHVVGLFRIWSIPYDEPLENKGLYGFFDPGDEKIWYEHGKKILSVILNNTEMLLCAEDLGVIPKVCPKALEELGIPGDDVQRWVKDWKLTHDFLKPRDYRILSVAMLSTHDTTNWPAWWKNEAGTVDEGLFLKKCCDHRMIDFNIVKERLFDLTKSGHGRLRWLDSIDSVDKLVTILGKRKEELADFIGLYENTYQEKEKLWRHLKIQGLMKEESDSEIVRAALRITLESSTIFCINLIIDYLYLTDIFKGGPYQYRINTPGTISEKNWSLVIPVPLEDLLRHKVCDEIRDMVVSSARI